MDSYDSYQRLIFHRLLIPSKMLLSRYRSCPYSRERASQNLGEKSPRGKGSFSLLPKPNSFTALSNVRLPAEVLLEDEHRVADVGDVAEKRVAAVVDGLLVKR